MKDSYTSMGDQGHIWSPIMRSSRGKMVVYLAVLGTIFFGLVLLSSTHSNLKQLEGVNDKCQQQRDSLSAQLQVVYEHKNRLEKSLAQERSDHKHTREEYEDSRNKQELELRSKTESEEKLKKKVSELNSKYTELEMEKKRIDDSYKEQLESQTQKEEETKKLQMQVAELLKEKDNLEQSESSLVRKIEKLSGDISQCQMLHQQVEEQLSDCKAELKSSKLTNSKIAQSSPSPQVDVEKSPAVLSQDQKIVTQGPPSSKDKLNVLERPHIQPEVENNRVDDVHSEKISNDKLQKQPEVEKNDIDLKNDSLVASKHQLPLPMLRHSISFNKQLSDMKNSSPARNGLNNGQNSPILDQRDSDNLPQVQPPDQMNQHGEKGEYPNGLMLPGQLEQPEFNKDQGNHNEEQLASNLKKSVLPMPNINEQGANAAAQVQEMLEKSPGDTNDVQNNPLHVPAAREFHAAADKLNLLNREPNLGKEEYGNEDDDDQDGDNEEEIGAGQGVREKGFQEQDFDEQQEPNAREEEGVVVAPK